LATNPHIPNGTSFEELSLRLCRHQVVACPRRSRADHACRLWRAHRRRSEQARPRKDFNRLKFQADVVSGDRRRRDRPTACLRDRLHLHASRSR
jgi:hypothetical protein